MAQLHPQELGFLFDASYDSQGYGGGIWTRLHTGSEIDSASMNYRYHIADMEHVSTWTTKRVPNSLSGQVLHLNSLEGVWIVSFNSKAILHIRHVYFNKEQRS
jgi:hypothetical protein